MMNKTIPALVLMLGLLAAALVGCAGQQAASGAADSAEKIPIKVLILPKFEMGNMEDDEIGEGELYHDGYLVGCDEYDIENGLPDDKLHVKDGVALYEVGEGKVSAALATNAVLDDERFDFSEAYIISTGCAGSAMGSTVMGDVFIISAAVDYDLGHHADPREMETKADETWFHEENYDGTACVELNPELVDKVYNLVKDVPVKTTDKTRAFMSSAFDGQEWAVRDPKVLRGTTATSDNYWKGAYDHANAELMVKTYGCKDPYVTTEMEDVAIGVALERRGMLDRYIIIRCSVNMDVFMNGATPESLWGSDDDIRLVNSQESTGVFNTALENNFAVGRVVIDAILDGTL